MKERQTVLEAYKKISARMCNAREQTRIEIEKGHKNVASELSAERALLAWVMCELENTEEVNPTK